PVGRVGRLRRWSELHRTASTLLLFLALLLAAAPLVWGWRQIAAESRRREAVSDARQRARDAHAERTDLRTRATTLEQELRSLDKRVEPWAAVDDPGKRRLLAGRNELAALRRAANELGHAARFAADEALELAEGETDELEQERVEILRTVYLQAESDRDQSAMRTWSDELRSLGREDLLAGTGHLTLISQPAGASVVIRKWVPGVDGRLVLDETPAYTGATPIVDLELPLGSFVAHLEAPGYMTSNYPVLIERNQHWGHNSWHDGAFSSQNWTIKLPRIADVDSERWCLIHGGPFLGVTDQDATPEEGATEWFWEDAFLIERTETNYRRYGRFLDDADQRVLVWQSIVDEQPRYVPREGPPWKPLDTIASSEDQDLDGALKFAPFEKFLELPVTGVSQRDAVDFAAWESEHSEYLHQLPSARQWEKAARGVDGRPFPWGQIFRRSFAHGPADSSSKVTLDYEVGTMPSDESPYGVRDLAGGVREWCRDGPALQEEFVNPWLAGGDISSSCLNPIDFVVWPRIHRAFSDLYLSWGFRLVREATRKQAR
ncbi:MAG: SUMF1/EgtB/PvdO family nonheme iron enzyme, partial [Planctomycetes bacterium]|nr:SUMF1/EgtB/PvdO family nonheme iron enzyme [Planctomycetota bacterium]